MKFFFYSILFAVLLASPVSADTGYNYSLETGDLNLCGHSFRNHEQAISEISAKSKLFKSDENFIVYTNDETKQIWNFTTEFNPAHPSIVCQRLTRIDGEAVMATEVNCTVEKKTCDYLTKYFADKSSYLMKKAHDKK